MEDTTVLSSSIIILSTVTTFSSTETNTSSFYIVPLKEFIRETSALLLQDNRKIKKIKSIAVQVLDYPILTRSQVQQKKQPEVTPPIAAKKTLSTKKK